MDNVARTYEMPKVAQKEQERLGKRVGWVEWFKSLAVGGGGSQADQEKAAMMRPERDVMEITVFSKEAKEEWTCQHLAKLTQWTSAKQVLKFLSVKSKHGEKFTRAWKIGHLATDEVRDAAIHDIMLAYHTEYRKAGIAHNVPRQNEITARAARDIADLYGVSNSDEVKKFEELGSEIAPNPTWSTMSSARWIVEDWFNYFEGWGDKPKLPGE